jgi:cysteine-rich repeat protein
MYGTGEICDDGNTINGDGCSNICIPEIVIIDGVC